jgi:hypothetical protein
LIVRKVVIERCGMIVGEVNLSEMVLASSCIPAHINASLTGTPLGLAFAMICRVDALIVLGLAL